MQHNPYAAPQAGLELPFQPAYAPRLFAVNGRIGRVRYVAYCMLGIAYAAMFGFIVALLAYVAERFADLALRDWPVQVMAAAFFLIPISAILLATRRRLHDFDVSGWWTLLLLVPLFQIIFVIYLLISPGTPDANDFGPAPPRTPLGMQVGVVLGCLLLLGFITLRFL